MNDDIPENDALWRLLGKARQPSVTPFFARNVLREIRQSRSACESRHHGLLRWLAPAVYAVLALGFFLALDPLARPSVPPRAAADFSGEHDDWLGLDDPAALIEFTPAHLAGY